MNFRKLIIGRIFRAIFFDFFEISKNRSKNQKKKKRNGSWKGSTRLRFEQGFYGFIDVDLLYNSVKFRFKTEHFWSFSGPVSIFTIISKNISFFYFFIFRVIFWDFEEIEKNRSKNPMRSKRALKMIKIAPFWAGISRICRGDRDLQIREIPVQNGALLIIFKTHFVFDFSIDFLRFRRNRKKSIEKSVRFLDIFFSSIFSRFLRNLEKSLEKSNKNKTKWVLKMIKKAPFWAGISRICRSRSPLQIRAIPAQNGAFLSIFRPHFVFCHIFL